MVDSTTKQDLSNKDPIFQEDVQDFQPRKVHRRVISFVLGILIVIAVAVGSYFFLEKDDIDLQRGKAQHENFQGVVAFETMTTHSSPQDCWMAIHGNVYDLTEYAPIHPGAPSLITRHCGKVATADFDLEHSIVLLPIVNEYLLGSLQSVTESPTTIQTPMPTTQTPTLRPTTAAPTEPGATLPPTMKPTTAPPTLRPTTAAPTELWGCPMEYYTLADVAQHPDANSCWYVLYGVVYDFTNYIDDHKGGRGTILAECGTDATIPYEAEKKHDVQLLIKKGFSSFIIGRLGQTRETGRVACDEVDLVAVTVAI